MSKKKKKKFGLFKNKFFKTNPTSTSLLFQKKEACSSPKNGHRGQEIVIGKVSIFAGAWRDLEAQDIETFDLLVPLNSDVNIGYYGDIYSVFILPLRDYGGVPTDWEQILKEDLIPLLDTNKTLVYCMGGHGRTGTVLASLFSILEPKIKDPIAHVRKIYCKKAVESREQAQAVFKLKGQALPKIYEEEFPKYFPVRTSYKGYFSKDYASKNNAYSQKDFLCPECKIKGYKSYLYPGVCTDCGPKLEKKKTSNKKTYSDLCPMCDVVLIDPVVIEGTSVSICLDCFEKIS